jgi:predicted nucleic acid-binding protein
VPFVLDASVAVVWHLEDEDSEYSERMLVRLNTEGALTPSIWPMELANVLLVAERRGRLLREKVTAALNLSLGLPISVQSVTTDALFNSIVDLARSEGLSVYDATYLDLAMREGLALATLDTDLRAAAARVGVALAE